MPDVHDINNMTERTEDLQRRIRLFVTDTVTATIGQNVSLDRWVASAIYEKLSRDITSYYPKFGTHDPETVQRISALYDGQHHGLLYLHRDKTVVLLKVGSKRAIEIVRSRPEIQPDRQLAQKTAEELDAAGLPCTTSAVLYIPMDSNVESDIWVEAYHPDPETEQRSRHFVNALLMATITQNSSRDVQKLPGPSDLANPCDLCVARRLAASCGIDMKQTVRYFSLKAWVGTSMHEKLENDLSTVYRYAEQEITVPIEVIPDLGAIKGHVDAFFPRKLTMSDWKSTDMKKLQRIKKYGVSPSHFGQTMLYMLGLRKMGMDCDYATLTYIPRDSNKVSDIWVASCAYREDVAVGLLNRTKSLLERLKVGDVGSLLSDPDCYVCNVQHRIRR
jgi:hypothetical protein